MAFDMYGITMDWLDQCEPAKDCEIPVVLELATPDTLPSGPDMRRPDIYRWLASVQLYATDGRALPDGALTFDEIAPIP